MQIIYVLEFVNSFSCSGEEKKQNKEQKFLIFQQWKKSFILLFFVYLMQIKPTNINTWVLNI